MPLRIGINALYLVPGGVGGTEIYLGSLLQALAVIDPLNEYFVLTNRETEAQLVPNQTNFHQVPQKVNATFRPYRLVWEQAVLPREIRQYKLNVLFNPGFTAPFFASCPNVTVFHDLQHKRHPEHFRRLDLPFWQFFLYWSARRSKMLIAVSEATRTDLLKYYRLPETKIRVVPHGVDEAFFEVGRRRSAGNLRPFLLCVSTLHPHKNLDRLVRAFGRIHGERPEFRLVLAGMHGFHTTQIEQTITDCGMREHVEITGWLPRNELLDLFEMAWAFVYPSTFEGFGMPVLEALAAGLPSAVSSVEPIKGIAGSAALLFDPFREEEMSEALLRLIRDEELRHRLSTAGPLRAGNFSWRMAAGQTLRVIETAAK